MKTVRTVESTTCLQGEDGEWWVQRANSPTGPVVVSCWEPSPEERARIAMGANIQLAVWGNSQPALTLDVTEVELGKAPDMAV